MDGWVIQIILYLNVFLIGVLLAFGIMQWRAHRAGHSSSKAGTEVLPEPVREEVIDHARKHYQQAVYRSAVELDKNLASTTKRLNESLEKLRLSVAADEDKRYSEALSAIRDQAAKIVGSTASEIEEHKKQLRQHFMEHQQALDAQLQKEASETEAELLQQRQDYQKRQAAFEKQLLEHQQALEAALSKRETSLSETQTQLENKLLDLEKHYVEKQRELEAKLEADIAARRAKLAGTLETELADTMLAFLSDALGDSIDLSSQSAALTKLLDAHKDELLAGVRGGQK